VVVRPERGSETAFHEAGELKKRFNDAFWMEDEGFIALGLDAQKRQIRSITSNPGHCIATAIVDESIVQRTADRMMAHDEDAIGELDGLLDIVRDEEDRFFALPDTDEIAPHFQANPTAGSIQRHRTPAVSLDIGGDQLFRLCLSLSLACEVKKIQNVAT
jgi:hypothetical protein